MSSCRVRFCVGMDIKLFVIVIIMSVWSAAALPPSTRQYRDYKYNKRTDAFYKLHIEPELHQQAQARCLIEGATLMVPSHDEDLAQLHGMLKKFPDIGDFVHVGNDEKEHTSAEETPIIDMGTVAPPVSQFSNQRCELANRDMEILTEDCYHSYPYVCKVAAKDIVYDDQCGVYGTPNGYKYYQEVHSCYSVPSVPLSWSEAFSECRLQGAHLVVLNSELESRTVNEFLRNVPAVKNARTSYFFFAGIRANEPQNPLLRVWTTIFNETLQDAGFAEWSTGEPNNHQNKEYCGSIFSNNGKYNDVDCNDRYGFICEKEVP